MRHCWPFLVHRFLYVAVHEGAKLHPLLIRQALSEQHDGSEWAGLCDDRNLGLIEVIPDLHGDETNEQTEDDPKWW